MITTGGPSSFLLEVKTAGSPSQVTFESALQPGVEVMMRDDGTGGDRIAGDGIYTISLASVPVLAAMKPDDVNRPFLGYVRPYLGFTVPPKYNIFGEVADAQIPSLPVTIDAPDVQHTDYLVNIMLPAAFPSASSPSAIPDQAPITSRFFQFFPDDFDFIDIIYVPSFFQNRGHYMVRNSVKGIGIPLMDRGQTYGSAVRLLGISVFPLSIFFDGANIGAQHETAHQWINYLNVTPL